MALAALALFMHVSDYWQVMYRAEVATISLHSLQASGIFYVLPHPPGWGYNESPLRVS